MAKAATKKKGASRNSRPSKGSKGAPGWLWLTLGLAMGIFVAVLWHLSELRQEPRKSASRDEIAAPEEKKVERPAAQDKEKEEPRFEFYTLLPNQEVIPGKPKSATPSQSPAAKSKEIQYLLQAGSFKSEAEADKRRASILMLGMPVRIAKVPGKAGETWYRVVVGPFSGKTAAQSARDSLRGNGVDTLVIKQG